MAVVMGINCSGFHSSACLLADGTIKAAIAEERLSRIKRDKSFPLKAIRYCCDAAGLALEEITDVFVGWNPARYFHKSDHVFHEAMQNRGKLSHLAVNELAALRPDVPKTLRHELETLDSLWRIHFVDHHKAHLANGFLQSGFPDADFLIADGFGEMSAGFTGTVTPDGIEEFSTNRTPHSLGLFYSTFTEFLGFTPNGDEWKIMALASLGDPEEYFEAIRAMIRVSGLRYELDLSFFENFLFFTPKTYSRKLMELLGPPVESGQELGTREHNIVAAVQRVVEEVAFELLANLHARTGKDRLIAGGGFFMNSVLNGKIAAHTPYEELFIGGSPDDSGVAIGSALFGNHFVLGEETDRGRADHNFFGRGYSDEEIEGELRKRKIRYRKSEHPAADCARHIRDGRIVAWFQGASEFGQRALGNRSILADPTHPGTKDLINAHVKYREPFRPFAPAVLAERQDGVFSMEGNPHSHFMERVVPFRDAWKEKVPAVVHFDGSGRLQTVNRSSHGLFYDVIVEFEKISGCPLVLNTSLNISGMPLVESPGDAVDCFYRSGIDTLFLHDLMIEK
jgi:carbamoyltransferase